MNEILTVCLQPTPAAAYREKNGGETCRLFYPSFPRVRQRITAKVGDTRDTYPIRSQI